MLWRESNTVAGYSCTYVAIMENESLKLIVIVKETFYAHYLPTVMQSWFFFQKSAHACIWLIFCTYKPGLLIRKQSYIIQYQNQN